MKLALLTSFRHVLLMKYVLVHHLNAFIYLSISFVSHISIQHYESFTFLHNKHTPLVNLTPKHRRDIITQSHTHAVILDEDLDFELIELLTVSDLAEGPTSLAEGPSNIDALCLHLNRAHYNSPEILTNLAESPWNYISETESYKL
jgi:hypothetical protein